MTCNDCGRDIDDCDRYRCREVRGTAWEKWSLAMTKKESSDDNCEAGELAMLPVDAEPPK